MDQYWPDNILETKKKNAQGSVVGHKANEKGSYLGIWNMAKIY